MPSFIADVLQDLYKHKVDISQLKFIVPSKRAGVFLKQEIAKKLSRAIFTPQITSIEEFVEELSQLHKVSNTELLFEFYEVYKLHTAQDHIEPFDSFLKWAQVLLQDFNEIDRYLIAPNRVFDYLSAIQDINHWSLEENKTPLIKNYLNFWNKLNTYYEELSNELLKKRKGYQGLLYREAVENLESYIQYNESTQHVFLGFNALNACESTIIKELLQNGIAKVYWDIDKCFVENEIHSAGLFIRQYLKQWSYYKSNPITWFHNYYKEKKQIEITGIPKNIGQVKYVGELLSKIKKEQTHLNKVAVVLSDENLLIPMLSSIPSTIEKLNITMGCPLRTVPLASLFDQLFILHKKEKLTFYYKDVIALLSHQSIRPLFIVENKDLALDALNLISHNNLAYLSLEKIKLLIPQKERLVELLFGNWNNSPDIALKYFSALIICLKNSYNETKETNLLSLEYLFRFNELFNVLSNMNNTFNHVSNIETLFGLYNELLRSETIDFRGEPLQGLQIMGMLESRVLDFDTVIITSCNEGILPAGKGGNSFIPYDVKREYGLPTYREKDAIYTYHFYHLIQRAKNVYITYNTEPDVIKGGEKSRLITQLEIEKMHNIRHQVVLPKTPKNNTSLLTIKKTKQLVEELKVVAQKGFSPSSLTTYIRNPIDFYYQKILGVYEPEEVEETIAANTLGTVVHNTLEDCYKPLEGQLLNLDHIKEMRQKVDQRVLHHLNSLYKEGDITKGKNLIIYEIAKRYITNFLNSEANSITKGNTIKIIKIEEELESTITIDELNHPINLIGKVDRVDMFNDTLRIIDFKTGRVDQSNVEIVDWANITTDYTKHSKSFQVLMYSYMMHTKHTFDMPVETGIISFKNLKAGFLKFAKKDRLGYGAKKETFISQETLSNFEDELKKLLLEIFNPNVNFVEKELD